MTLSAFLGTIVEHGRTLWPFHIVSAWEQGVRTFCGRIRGTCTHENGLWHTGLHVCWPVLGAIKVQDSNVEGLNTAEQTLTTADGIAVVVQVVARYQIADMAVLYAKIHDHERTIKDTIEGQIGEWVCSIPWAHEAAGGFEAELVDHLTEEITALLDTWGVKLEDLQLRTCVRARAYRIFNGQQSQTTE